MSWNWELPDWPHFKFDPKSASSQEKQFLLRIGSAAAFLKTLKESEYHQFIVEILSLEGMESARIEGEILERESLQSSIKQHFGLIVSGKQISREESQMAAILCDVYESFKKPLSHSIYFAITPAIIRIKS